jgi:hypothetical protein
MGITSSAARNSDNNHEESEQGRPAKAAAEACEGQCCEDDRSAADVGDVRMYLPVDMQEVVVGFLSFRELAQLACVSKQLRTFCLNRVRERDRVVATRLESDFTPEFREGLSPAQTALPRDLLVDPKVRG